MYFHNIARVWQDKSIAAFCVRERESAVRGWLIDSLQPSACSCKWESVDMPESAHKRQSISCPFHLLLSFSPSFFCTCFPFFSVQCFLLFYLSLLILSLCLNFHVSSFSVFFLLSLPLLLFIYSTLSPLLMIIRAHQCVLTTCYLDQCCTIQYCK